MMKIEFLNVWSGKTGAVIEKYLSKEAGKMDVFCLQEADEQFSSISGKILGKDFIRFWAYKYLTNEDVFFQETWVRNGLEVVQTNSVLQELKGTGLGLDCQIRTRKGVIRVINVHGVSRPGNKLDTPDRIIQSHGITEVIGENNGSVIIGGDFNLDRSSESVKLFETTGYRNLIKEYSIKTTRNQYVWNKYPNSPQYDSDYVFIGPNIKVRNFEVVDNLVADHLPMILEIKD